MARHYRVWLVAMFGIGTVLLVVGTDLLSEGPYGRGGDFDAYVCGMVGLFLSCTGAGSVLNALLGLTHPVEPLLPADGGEILKTAAADANTMSFGAFCTASFFMVFFGEIGRSFMVPTLVLCTGSFVIAFLLEVTRP